ncbi:hypothetical protein HanHA300_Chr04g0154021 [Helianthus annuus]|nr:hypothetical protein HanHA300_Chr04g0154021 [Helianthus annuus]
MSDVNGLAKFISGVLKPVNEVPNTPMLLVKLKLLVIPASLVENDDEDGTDSSGTLD